MERLSFTAGEFEGPLELILHLVTKHQINIQEIEISSLLEQYMAAIAEMQQGHMELASEFLEMASRLVYIKSASLLPRQEEEPDPRAELVGQLLEYQACREAAMMLRQRMEGFGSFVRAPMEYENDPTYEGRHMSFELSGHYADAMGRGRRRLPPPREAFDPLVRTVVVPVSSRVNYILRELYEKARLRLAALFAASADRSELVATFMAVLVLIRDSRIRLAADDSEIVFSQSGAAMGQDYEYDTGDEFDTL